MDSTAKCVFLKIKLQNPMLMPHLTLDHTHVLQHRCDPKVSVDAESGVEAPHGFPASSHPQIPIYQWLRLQGLLQAPVEILT